MSIELLARAKKTQVGGDSTTKLVLISLADYANDDRMAWPSIKTLRKEVEKGERQIQRSLRKLESLDLIRLGDQSLTKSYPKGQRPIVYEILPAKTRRRGVTHDTRTGDTHDTTPGVVHDTPTGVMDDTTTPVTHDTTTGVTHDTTPVTHMTPGGCHPRRGTGVTHDTQTPIGTTNKPPRESTRASKTEKPRQGSERSFDQRMRLLDEFHPDGETIALAINHGLDLDRELDQFRDTVRANGKPPYDPQAAFRKFLRTGIDNGYAPAAGGPVPTALGPTTFHGFPSAGEDAELERRARKLVESSTPLKRRQPDRDARLRWVPAVKRLLAQGRDPVAIVDTLAHGTADELAALGIELDDLEAVA